MKEENEKKTWETPEIVDLDLENTQSGSVPITYENTNSYNVS